MKSTLYRSRSSAIRAARRAAQIALGPLFQAYEFHDFNLYPVEVEEFTATNWRDRWQFELVGPAANPDPEEHENAAAAWAARGYERYVLPNRMLALRKLRQPATST